MHSRNRIISCVRQSRDHFKLLTSISENSSNCSNNHKIFLTKTTPTQIDYLKKLLPNLHASVLSRTTQLTSQLRQHPKLRQLHFVRFFTSLTSSRPQDSCVFRKLNQTQYNQTRHHHPLCKAGARENHQPLVEEPVAENEAAKLVEEPHTDAEQPQPNQQHPQQQQQPTYICSHAKLASANHNQHVAGESNQMDEAGDKSGELNQPTTKVQPKSFDEIPGPKPSLPFIGTNWIYFPWIGYYQSMKLHDANLDKYHRYGPIMKEEYQRGRPSVTIFHPSDIKQVFMHENACPSRPVQNYVIQHRKSDPSRYPNVGLANMMGEEWLDLRSQLAPLLLSQELKKRHIGSQNRVSTRLVNYIKNLLPRTASSLCNENDDHEQQNSSSQLPNASGIVPNIQEVFYRFSMESIMNLCINQELDCLNATSTGDENSRNSNFNAVLNDGESIFRAAMNFFEAQHRLHYGSSLWKYYNTKPYRQLRDSQNSIHDIASKYIDVAISHLKQKQSRRVDDRSKENDEHESLLETLFTTNKFNDLEIKSTIVDFIGGGIYTVANTLTMALFLLASNAKVQEQLYQEICQVFNEESEIGSDITIDMKKLEDLKFLKLCLKESYRLLPTIPGIARTLHKDMVLSNYVVPKDTLVFCNFMVTCRLPQYFDDPDCYNPSRWERTGNSSRELAFCLLPFGYGVRKCIGHNFAELEIYVALAKLIRSFKVTTVDGQDAKTLDLSYKFIVVPEKPVTLKFTPRNTNGS